MSTPHWMLKRAAEQSAADIGCSPEDLFGNENVCVSADSLRNAARRWLPDPPILHMVSYGPCVATLVMPQAEKAVAELLENGGGPAWKYFQPEYTSRFAQILADAGAKAYLALDICYLPGALRADVRPALQPDAVIRILKPVDFAGLYSPEWGNALTLKRPQADVLGAGAYIGGELVGLAGCSEETPSMWQIGVDVLPEYRRRGLARRLVSTLTAAASERGHVPYYTAAQANIQSLGTATAVGLQPAWAQLTAMPRDEQGAE